MSEQLPNLAPALSGLTERQRIYVEARLKGMTQAAAATVAGLASASQTEAMPAVQAALSAAKAITARAVGFTRKEAHDMLMAAYHAAESAGEMVAAVKELVKLHGIAEPVEVRHTHEHHEFRKMSDEELLKYSGGLTYLLPEPAETDAGLLQQLPPADEACPQPDVADEVPGVRRRGRARAHGDARRGARDVPA